MFGTGSNNGNGIIGSGCGCGTNTNNGASGTIWSNSGLKKQQKRPKVPKRGPGVAELEKILREQENTDRGPNANTNNNNNNGEGFSVSPSCFNNLSPPPPPLKPHPSPPPPSLPPTHIPRFDPPIYAYTTSSSSSSLGRNIGNLVFPDHPLFPMNPSSSDGYTQSDHSANSSSKNFSTESNNPLWSYSYPALPQKKHHHHNNNSQYTPTMMKQFLGHGGPTSSSTSQTGLHNQVAEPPSNQTSYFNGVSGSGNPEEHKTVGMKRSHPSSFDNSLVPPTTHFQVSPMLSNFTRPHKSAANDNNVTATSFTSSSNSDYFYRDAKYWGSSSLGYNSRKLNSDHNGGPCHPKFPSFNAPAILPSQSQPIHMFQREFCKGEVLPNQVSQDRMEDSYQRSESSSGSDHHRTFYSFLEVKEEGKKVTTLGSNLEGCEARKDGIDLSLKL